MDLKTWEITYSDTAGNDHKLTKEFPREPDTSEAAVMVLQGLGDGKPLGDLNKTEPAAVQNLRFKGYTITSVVEVTGGE